MPLKTSLTVFLAAGIGFIVAAAVVSRQQAARHAAHMAEQQAAWLAERSELEAALAEARARAAARVPTPSASVAVAPPVDSAPAQSGPPIDVGAPGARPAANTNVPPRAKPELQDPLARAALSLVGADADAEEYWAEAINDPTLSAHERQDLIEDLNEEGFSDPKNLTVDDLPLILSRILLIEDYVFDAMDEVNAAAFLEAYKDLVNMYGRLTQR